MIIQTTIVCLIMALASCAAQENRMRYEQDISPAEAMKLDTAYLANGCFWCSEAAFERLKGVKSVVSGYSGGHTVDPSYREVSTGKTGHAETIRVIYDDDIVSYRELLYIFFDTHDPTQLNRQGHDIGTQYRSAIFYTSDKQEVIAEDVKRELNASEFNGKIVTTITEFDTFYPAEAYHQGFYNAHPYNPYIINVTKPIVQDLKKSHPEALKEGVE